MKRILAALFSAILLCALGAAAQQASPQLSAPSPAPSAEFLKAADEVLAAMSELLSLPVKSPLKKTLRTREEIRDYILRKMKEDKEPAKRYADQKGLEKFGLIPKGFQVEPFLVDLLTEQIAGLYDPKSQEFFIADWIGVADQRMVMAHELTHALHDQYFKVEPWLEGAKPNDDAGLARDAVLEGSALAAMVDYLLRDGGKGVRDLPSIEPLMRSQMLGDMDKSPHLAKAPPFLRDALLFPYLGGTTFTQRVLKASSGWADFHKVFENPPASTQQILHPDLYLSGVAPQPVALPDLGRLLPPKWKKLDENVLGEFVLLEILKQFLGEERARRLAPAWVGDRYALLEHQETKQLLLVVRLRLATEADAARFFGNYSEVLELKYDKRRALFRRPNYFSFETDDGGVFLRCLGDQCLSVEGATGKQFEKIAVATGWPSRPSGGSDYYRAPQKTTVSTAVTTGN